MSRLSLDPARSPRGTVRRRCGRSTIALATLALALGCNESTGTEGGPGGGAQAATKQGSSGAPPSGDGDASGAAKPKDASAGQEPAAGAEPKPSVDGSGAPPSPSDGSKPDGAGTDPRRTKTPPKKPTVEEARTAGSSIRELLDAGRSAVKKKDYETGIAKYEAALAIDPVEPKVLGELGWALFLAGRNDDARNRLYDALVYNRDAKSRGAILYNLGRVAEAQGQPENAADFYRRSLVLRTNDTVKARLTALAADTGISTHPGCELELRKAEWSFDLCAAYVKEVGTGTCDANDLEQIPVVVDAAGTPMGGEMQTRVLADLGNGWTLHTFRVEHQEEWMTDIVLAVVHERTWWTSVIAVENNPGVGYVSESSWVQSAKTIELPVEKGVGVVVHWTHDFTDGDYVNNEAEGISQAYQSLLVLFPPTDGKPASAQWQATVRTMFEWSIGPFLDEADPPDVQHSEGYGKKRTLQSEVTWLPATGELETRTVAETPAASPTGKFVWNDFPIRCPKETVYFGD